jgi:predicted membrane protein
MRLSLYTLLALLSSFFFLFYYYYHKRDGGEFVKTQHLFLFFSGQIASLYTYTIVYITFLCTPETFGAPEVYLNTSKSAWRNKKQQNKTRSSAGRHWLYKHTDEPHGVQLGGKKQNGMGEDEILYSIESRGIFRYFFFLLTLRLPHVVVVVPLAARPYCYLLSL